MIVLECGGGWIAHWMDRLDEFLESYGWATPELSLTPTEYFQRQCWICFDPGETHRAGAAGRSPARTASSWASDFPHSDAKYPGRRRRAARVHRGHGSRRARAACSAATRCDDVRARGRAGAVVSADLDLLVRGGTVVDGTGAPARTADVAVARRPGRRDRSGRRRPARTEVDRRRRAARHARLRRHPHALRRAAALGPDRVARVVARRHDAADRQLRLHARAEQARRPRVAAAHARPRRGHVGRRARGRRHVPRRHARRLPRRSRRPARRERRRQRRALRGAPRT